MNSPENRDVERATAEFMECVQFGLSGFLLLFVIQPILGIKLDGKWFWSIYATLAVIYSIIIFSENRPIANSNFPKTENIYHEDRYTSIYICGLASLSPIVMFFIVLAIYWFWG